MQRNGSLIYVCFLCFLCFSLLTIISTRVKYDRKNKKRTESRRNSEGLTSREQQKQESIKIIKELKRKGLSQSKVSKESGYSIALVKRYWNL